MADEIKDSDRYFVGGFAFRGFFDRNGFNVKGFAAVRCPDGVFKFRDFFRRHFSKSHTIKGHGRSLRAIAASSALSGELTGGISNMVVYCCSPSAMCAMRSIVSLWDALPIGYLLRYFKCCYDRIPNDFALKQIDGLFKPLNPFTHASIIFHGIEDCRKRISNTSS